MIFSELYGAYYKVMAKIINSATCHPLEKGELYEIMVVVLSSGNACVLQLDGDGFLGLFHSQAGELLGVNELAALAQIKKSHL